MNDGELFPLSTQRAQRWLLGSEQSCDFCVVDPFVSGTHALLERRSDGAVLVRDRDSKNGTFIDGNPVQVAELRAGSCLTIGRTALMAVSSIASGSENQPRAIEMLRGNDPVLRMVIDQAIRAAQTDCNVLVLGETGTGKDLMARLVHESSRRSTGPFVAVNCGAIARELIASELFGHEKGAFTGASEIREGYFVEANGGTLFLDEIGELPLELQPHLLRALETRRVRRVGGQNERSVDVRIVAATNQTDGLGTDASRLRLDLYHRIATVVLNMPPLRERMCDLVELVEAMLKDFEPEYGEKNVTGAGWKSLACYGWPGNVRELRHAVARAVTLGGDDLGPTDFFPLGSAKGNAWFDLAKLDDKDNDLVPYHAMLRGAMETALQVHGTIRAAAKSLGMPKSTFADKAKAWGLMTKRRPRLPTDADMKKKDAG
jgi:DNA-binding NtrC family response regulator